MFVLDRVLRWMNKDRMVINAVGLILPPALYLSLLPAYEQTDKLEKRDS